MITAPATISAKAGTSTTQVSISLAHKGSFSAALTLSWPLLPPGVTATLSKTSLNAPGDGTVTATFTVPSSTPAGMFPAFIAATGGGQTQAFGILFTVTK